MLPIELFLLLLQDVPLFQEVLFAFRVDRRLEVRELGAGEAVQFGDDGVPDPVEVFALGEVVLLLLF